MRSGLGGDDLLGAIYDAAVFGGDWRPALEKLRIVLGVMETSLCTLSPDPRGKPAISRLKTSRHLHSRASEERVVRHYIHLDPKTRVFAGREVGFLFNDVRHFDERFVAHDQFYQECVLPLGSRHTLDMLLHDRNRNTTFLAAMRPGAHFSCADEEKFRCVSRHFRRAVEIERHVGEAQATARQALAALDCLTYGIVTLDHAGRVVLMNAFARAIFQSGGELELRRSRVGARSSSIDNRLDAMLRCALSTTGAASVLRVENSQGKTLFVWMLPLPPDGPLAVGRGIGALIVMRPEESSLELSVRDLETLYGLTRAEAELAIALGRGSKLPEIADRRGVTMATARTQLHWVLQKMDLQSQADVARTLASISRLAVEAAPN